MSTENTRKKLLLHYEKYPALEVQDLFKYLFHSTFGCEHFIFSLERVTEYLGREANEVTKSGRDAIEELDGEYVRLHLGCLGLGLRIQTLARIFYLSAKKEPEGKKRLEEKLRVAREMVREGTLPLSASEFDSLADEWRNMGYPAIHHSDTFREQYHPHYRVIARKYAELLPGLCEIDSAVLKGKTAILISGGQEVYNMLKEIYYGGGDLPWQGDGRLSIIAEEDRKNKPDIAACIKVVF